MALFGWLSNKNKPTKEQQRAFELGQTAGEVIGDDLISRAESFMEGRFAQFFGDYIDALKQRLDTVYDDPEHDPKLLAHIELKIFCENAEEAKSQLHAEFENYVLRHDDSYYELLGNDDDTVAFVQHAVSEVVDKNLADGVELLIKTGVEVHDRKIEEIEQRASDS